MYHEVHVPKLLISKIFEPFLKSCTVEVRVLRGRVPRGLTVLWFLLILCMKFFEFFQPIKVIIMTVSTYLLSKILDFNPILCLRGFWSLSLYANHCHFNRNKAFTLKTSWQFLFEPLGDLSKVFFMIDYEKTSKT